jgi:hypothetical protein
MTKDDIVATFFMKISEIRDQLGAIGETISNIELVLTTLNALPRHWEPFLQSISGRELDLIVYGQTTPRKKPGL